MIDAIQTGYAKNFSFLEISFPLLFSLTSYEDAIGKLLYDNRVGVLKICQIFDKHAWCRNKV